MALLGEAPLPSTATAPRGDDAGPAAESAFQLAVSMSGGRPAGRAVAAPVAGAGGVAEGDRVRLQAALKDSFVRGELQDMGVGAELQMGLKAGGQLSGATAAAMAAFAGRFTSGSSADTAVLQPEGCGLRAGGGGDAEALQPAAEVQPCR